MDEQTICQKDGSCDAVFIIEEARCEKGDTHPASSVLAVLWHLELLQLSRKVERSRMKVELLCT